MTDDVPNAISGADLENSLRRRIEKRVALWEKAAENTEGKKSEVLESCAYQLQKELDASVNNVTHEE